MVERGKRQREEKDVFRTTLILSGSGICVSLCVWVCVCGFVLYCACHCVLLGLLCTREAERLSIWNNEKCTWAFRAQNVNGMAWGHRYPQLLLQCQRDNASPQAVCEFVCVWERVRAAVWKVIISTDGCATKAGADKWMMGGQREPWRKTTLSVKDKRWKSDE